MWWIVCVHHPIEAVDLCILWVSVLCFKVVDWWPSALRWLHHEMSTMFYFEVRLIIYFISDNNTKIDIESFKNEGKFKISHKSPAIDLHVWMRKREERERKRFCILWCSVLMLGLNQWDIMCSSLSDICVNIIV